ncbi:MAG: TonB-dependent receptor [Bacteroidales bacterium]|nr:TonB-dependent receptor [Bacteroidales bacterium]
MILGLIGLFGLVGPVRLSAQEADSTAVNDSVIDRTVTVEREFQPTVQAAGKLPTKPQVYTPKFEKATFTYSDYSSPLGIEKNVNTLGYASTGFNRPHMQRGYIRGGIGHPNTLLDFNYRVDSESMGSRTRKGKARNEGYLDLHAQHFGQWGRKMLEKSSLGLDYTKNFSAAQLYFSAAGSNEYFTHYYRYINPADNRFTTDLKNFNKADNQMFWTGDALIGVQNIPGADILYKVQAGYEGFFIPGVIQEHQVHTKAMFEWSKNEHHVGLDADIKNRLYTGYALTGKHQIHAQPYYAYEGNRIRVHAGVNLDLGLGGYNRTFGASPNVNFEADITKTWLTFFTDAKGQLAAEGVRDELSEHRFLSVENLLDVMKNGCCAAYTPVDAVAGFRFKPLPTLLFDVHAGYAYTFTEHILGYNLSGDRFEHYEQDQQIIKVGGSLHYHYQDIFTMEISGDYFFGLGRELVNGNYALDLEQAAWSWANKPYGAPAWQVHARFDGRIDKHWALYSDNYLVGSRTQLLVKEATTASGVVKCKDSDVTLKPYFDLNLGAEYTYNDHLSFFAQLNNYLAWTADLTPMLLYRTPSQGVNCLFGVSYNF